MHTSNISRTIAIITFIGALVTFFSADQVQLFQRNQSAALPRGTFSPKTLAPTFTTLPTIGIERGDQVLYVDARNHNPVQDGLSWVTSFSVLQDALDAAEINLNVHKIKIACGTYKPTKTYAPRDENGIPVVAGAFANPAYNPGITQNGDFLNYADDPDFYHHKLITFNLINGVSLEGGYNKTWDHKNTCYCSSCRTILDGNLGTEASPDKVWHVVYVGNEITQEGVCANLENLTIQNGDASPAPYYPINYFLNPGQIPNYYHDDGGNINVHCKSFLNLYEVTIRRGTGIAGGGIYADDGSIINCYCCSFIENIGCDGAAIIIRNGGVHDSVDFNHRHSTLLLKDCNFYHNNATNLGSVAGYDNYGIDPTLGGPNIIIDGCSFKDFTTSLPITTSSIRLHV